ncbi:DUF7424 family protein [Morganella morganii]|uniref:DUF7424 family protein n=1 Tax=Morganella morganii TaxID=582 RepID=UPI0034D5D2B6
MKKILPVLIAVSLLAGCKVDVETTVNTDDLVSHEHKLVAGNINVEVPACNDFEDSRKESKSLIRIKEQMPAVFSGAEYKECYKEKFNSYASFTVPVGVGFIADDMKAVNAEIYILSNDELYAGVMITPEAIKRLKSAKKSSPGDLKLQMTLVLEKGNLPIPDIAAMSVFMTGTEAKNKPLIASRVGIAGKEVRFKLSDVSNALIESGNIAPVLYKAEMLEKLVANLKKD